MYEPGDDPTVTAPSEEAVDGAPDASEWDPILRRWYLQAVMKELGGSKPRLH